mgnify:CR=1 FL=1
MSTVSSLKCEMPRDPYWVLLEDMLRKEGLVRQHLDSYNEFVAVSYTHLTLPTN